MKNAKRPLAILMTLILLLGLFPLGALAASDEIDPDTGQEETIEAEAQTGEAATIDLAALTEDASPTDDTETDSGTVVQLDDTTTIEYTASENNREEALAEVLSDAAAESLPLADGEARPGPDAGLLASETDAFLWLSLADAGSAVSVQTDDGETKSIRLYYISETDGQLYSLAPDDEAVETPVTVDENGQAVIPIRRGAAVHIEVIGGCGHVIAASTLAGANGETIPDSGSHTYDLTMTDDFTLTVETEEVGVSIPDEDAVEGIQVMERNGIIINDPTVTLPAEETNTGSAGKGLRKISGNYWGEISARYEGGGTHPYPNGTSTGVFTVCHNDTYYTGVCIDPSYGAPGSGYVNQWRDWYYYNVPLKDNPTFFAAVAASYYSNFGSVDNTVAYINLRDRRNWDQVGAYMYSACGWGNVIDNSAYGHGFAMYHELLGYLANGWSWDRSVLGSSGIKSYIVTCCNSIYDLINPNGDDFWQYAYNVLYTYRVFYYQSTTAGKQRIAWTVPRTDYGTVTIQKVSSRTGEPLPGCTITLTDVNDPNHKFTATTDEDGIATFHWVTWTTYTVEEIEPPEDYLLSYEAEDVAFTASYTFKSIADDPATGTLTVVKLDHETKMPLAGAVFQIRDADGTVYAMATTPESGKITIEDIPYGDYTYQETTAPEGFALDPTVYSFTIEGGDTVTHTRENCRIPGSITVHKTDSGGNTLSGVTYLLQYSPDNGRRWYNVHSRDSEDVTVGGCTSIGLSDGKLTTGADGKASFTGLLADGKVQYRLTEVGTPSGYSLMAESIYVGTLPIPADESLNLAPYDVNGDGMVSGRDLRLLMKYLTNTATPIAAGSGDANGDGQINNKDLNRILKFVSDTDSETAFNKQFVVNFDVRNGVVDIPMTGDSGFHWWPFTCSGVLVAVGMLAVTEPNRKRRKARG